MPDARTVVVYSRKGCHLCEVVKESLSKLSRRGGFTWQEVDVDSDTELRRQFNDEVPVVFIDGRKAFKYRMDEQEFLRKRANYSHPSSQPSLPRHTHVFVPTRSCRPGGPNLSALSASAAAASLQT